MVSIRPGSVIVPPGVIIMKHEKITVDFLATHGLDVTFLTPNRQQGVKTADVSMLDIFWEIKSPIGKSPRTIENNMRAALRQSSFIVLDLRRMDKRVPTKRHLDEITRRFHDSKAIKRILVITKENELIDFS